MALSAQDLAAFHATSLPQQAAKATQKKGNFLTSLLPTIGGTGGGIAGGALGGAALGTGILPGVGTVAGGLLGALLGGGAGGALGKVAENKIEGQAMGNGVLGAGIENGVLSAGPLRLLKAGKIGAVAAKEGAGSLLSSLVRPVAADGEQIVAQATGQPLKTSAAGKLETWGNNQLAKQWGTLDKPTIRSTNPTATVGTLANMGITKPQDAERIAQGLTGSNGILNQAVVKAVGASGKVPVSGVGATLDKAIAEHGLVDKDAASVRQVVEAQLGKLGDGAKANPTQVMGVMKSIEQRIANLGGKGGNYRMATPERLDQAKALQAVHKELEDSLYKAAGADKNIGGVMTSDVRDQLVALHPNNQQWAASVEKMMSSKSIKELRGHQAPFVKASQMIDNAHDNSFSMGGQLGHALSGGGIKSAAVGAAANLVKDPASRLAGTAARSLAGKTTATDLATALGAPTAKTIIRNEVGGNMLSGALGANKSASAQSLNQSQVDPMTGLPIDPTNPAANQQIIDPSQTDQTTQTQDPNSPFNPANIEANVQQILASGGKMSDATAYLSLVKTMQDLTDSPAQKPLNSTQQQQAFNAQSGLKSLGDIAAALQQNPNEAKLAALPGGSLASSLTGTGSYKAAIANATDVIGRLRSGGAIGSEEEKQFKALLPQTFDSQQTAAYKLNQLQSLFSQFANPQAAQDPTDLLSALGAQ